MVSKNKILNTLEYVKKELFKLLNITEGRCQKHLTKFVYYGVMPVCHKCQPEYVKPKWVPTWRK